jgi:hypothetical protein
MIGHWQSQKSFISHLRIKCEGVDARLAQQRMALMMSAARLQPGRLASSSILCVKRLRDPLPGTLLLQSGAHAPPPAWERALNASLEELEQRAARPSRGNVSSDAEAVIFMDQSELLAALAQDWCEGLLGMRWWWKCLFKGKEVNGQVWPAWLDAPEYVPAALEQLAHHQRLASFIHAIGEAQAASMLERLTYKFALPEIRAAIRKWMPVENALPANDIRAQEENREEPDAFARIVHHDARHIRLDTRRRKSGVMMHAPWEPWVQEADDSTPGLARRCLVGLGLMLQRASWRVRTPDFARATGRWLEAASGTHASSRPSTPIVAREANTGTQLNHYPQTIPNDARRTSFPLAALHQPHTTQPLSASTTNDEASAMRQERNGGETENPQTARVASSHQRASSKSSHADSHAPEPASQPSTGTGEPGKLQEASPLPSIFKNESELPVFVSQPGTVERKMLAKEEEPEPALPFEAETETCFGGLFYFINLGLYLGLYDDFTSTEQAHPVLPIFDFVSLLGEHFLGERIKGDPVWSLLAKLSARGAQEPPGRDFMQRDEWRIPADWLAPFPEQGRWKWTVDEGRLRVLHSQGFCVMEMPLLTADDEAMPTLAREMEAYRGHAAFTLQHEQMALAPRATGLEHWMKLLLPYVRARLCRALGLNDDRDIPLILCEHRARVTLTPVHLNVIFAISELSLEVRLAGLDRNPGWVPAAGRFIAFDYV